MVNIMNYKVYIYVITTLLSVYTFSGINFEQFMKKNKVIEARILILLLSFVSGYLLTNFITDFLTVSKIL